MLGERYIKFGSKSDQQAEISGNIVKYEALPFTLSSQFLVFMQILHDFFPFLLTSTNASFLQYLKF